MLPLRSKYIYTSLAFIAICLCSAVNARADAVIVGNSTGTQATATITNVSLSGSGNNQTFSFRLTNTTAAPSQSVITGLGFDLIAGDFTANSSSGLNGFTGTSSNANFDFSDGSLGNVNQFNSAVLDFGFTTGNSGNFTGGSPNDGLAPGQFATFSITGNFQGLTLAQIQSAIFVRFQRVGANGQDSDVGRPGTITTPPTAVPEPATMLLLGTGLAGVAAKIRRRRNAE